jgi:hypothetical protein
VFELHLDLDEDPPAARRVAAPTLAVEASTEPLAQCELRVAVLGARGGKSGHFFRRSMVSKDRVGENKLAPPFTEAEFDIRWGTGVDPVTELIDLGVARGLVDKSGAHLSFAGAPLGNGRERAREGLVASADLQSTLRQAGDHRRRRGLAS